MFCCILSEKAIDLLVINKYYDDKLVILSLLFIRKGWLINIQSYFEKSQWAILIVGVTISTQMQSFFKLCE